MIAAGWEGGPAAEGETRGRIGDGHTVQPPASFRQHEDALATVPGTKFLAGKQESHPHIRGCDPPRGLESYCFRNTRLNPVSAIEIVLPETVPELLLASLAKTTVIVLPLSVHVPVSVKACVVGEPPVGVVRS